MKKIVCDILLGTAESLGVTAGNFDNAQMFEDFYNEYK